jgi:TolB protein
VFHREVSNSPQLFLVDVAGRRVRQLTSSGRNEDPTWAPDGRHITFVSDRSGARQLWVIDVETGRVRQLRTPGAARLPAWSRRLSRTAVAP